MFIPHDLQRNKMLNIKPQKMLDDSLPSENN